MGDSYEDEVSMEDYGDDEGMEEVNTEKDSESESLLYERAKEIFMENDQNQNGTTPTLNDTR